LVGKVGAQQIEQRRVWAGGIGLEAVAVQCKEASGERLGDDLGHQARLARTRFASDQDELAGTARRPVDDMPEGNQVGRPADDDRADQGPTKGEPEAAGRLYAHGCHPVDGLRRRLILTAASALASDGVA
jgi:hypothetical protein